ncbi:sugar-binding protein [Marinihelvus fidelis]|uniref:Sugar-binding protein n=1 Tax=Marinihelvus fidelis TaxID=2613842 RepID=A0A5N0T6P0_9GAMM|nr:sugar-binding protein [Marinihelvus fidelis]KAA9130542.1 sugar-binding protein [Marinihelvus fidelis]
MNSQTAVAFMAAVATLLATGTGQAASTRMTLQAPFAKEAPIVDGDPSDPAWEAAAWRPMDKLMLGDMPSSDDFSGRYKVVWTRDHLYLLAQITDDVLLDSHPDPLDHYWEDDTLEIFVDEDDSNGDHQFNYNAFAYHVGLDNQAVDTGPFRSPEDEAAGKQFIRVFPDHILSRWQRSHDAGKYVYWEVRITVYGSNFKDSYATGETPARPVTLSAGKELGFMVAYCDADVPGEGREHFVGDMEIEPVDGDRNRGWIDAGVFGKLVLKP